MVKSIKYNVKQSSLGSTEAIIVRHEGYFSPAWLEKRNLVLPANCRLTKKEHLDPDMDISSPTTSHLTSKYSIMLELEQ